MDEAPITLTPKAMLELWYTAAREEIGVTFTIELESAESLKHKMYAIRKDIGDDRLKDLALHLNKDQTTVLIYHKGSEEPLE